MVEDSLGPLSLGKLEVIPQYRKQVLILKWVTCNLELALILIRGGGGGFYSIFLPSRKVADSLEKVTEA